MRGSWPGAMECKNIVGSVNPRCPGTLRLMPETDPKDFPMRARHNPDAEWYRPTSEYEMQRMSKVAPRLYEYVIGGGLILRPPSGEYIFPVSPPPAAEEQT